MPSDQLFPSEQNTSPNVNRRSAPSGLEPSVEIGYGEQLSAITRLKQGTKSGNLFSPSPLVSTDELTDAAE
jgi:hypothetical protein